MKYLLRLTTVFLLGMCTMKVISGMDSKSSGIVHHLGNNSNNLDCNSPGPTLYCQDDYSTNLSKICYYCNNKTRICKQLEAVGCYLGKLVVKQCFCITYDVMANKINVGKCLYNCGQRPEYFLNNAYSYITNNISELNSAMCGGPLHRNGTLCGRCEDGYYPMAFSFNMSCVWCSKGHTNMWEFILFVFVPLTVFCFIVMVFRISATSSYLHGFILFSQAISMPAMARVLLLSTKDSPHYLLVVKIIGSFYSIWNFDILRFFSPQFCVHSNSYVIPTLDFFIGMYSLFLLCVTYLIVYLHDRKFKPLVIIWKALRKVFSLLQIDLNIQTSLIDSFATFFILSNIKFLSVCFDLLAHIQVYTLSSSTSITYLWGSYYDASTSIHKVTTTPACFILFIFVIIPALLLFVYPFPLFQKCLNKIPIQWYVLHTYVDSFQGAYKNGADSKTRDWRWFSSVFLLSRLFIFMIYIFTLSSVFFSYAAMLCCLLVIILIIFLPFTVVRDNFTNCIYILLLATFYSCINGINLGETTNFNKLWIFYYLAFAVTLMPILFLTALILYWLKKRNAFTWKAFK